MNPLYFYFLPSVLLFPVFLGGLAEAWPKTPRILVAGTAFLLAVAWLPFGLYLLGLGLYRYGEEVGRQVRGKETIDG